MCVILCVRVFVCDCVCTPPKFSLRVRGGRLEECVAVAPSRSLPDLRLKLNQVSPKSFVSQLVSPVGVLGFRGSFSRLAII